MDRDRASDIAHAGIAIANPIPESVLDRFVGECALASSDRLLDIGCGRGELVLRAVERTGCRALGVDRSPRQIATAWSEAARRVPGADVKFQQADAGSIPLEAGAFRLVACVGSSHALGGLTEAIARLTTFLAPGGRLLLGDGYWTEPPSAEYLAAWGATVEELPDLAQLHAWFDEHRLGIADEYHATVADWDAYEEPWATNLETYAAEHPKDPDAPEMLAWAAEARARRRLGPGVLGFALVLTTPR